MKLYQLMMAFKLIVGAGCLSILAGMQALSFGEITGGSLADGSDGTVEILYSSISNIHGFGLI